MSDQKSTEEELAELRQRVLILEGERNQFLAQLQERDLRVGTLNAALGEQMEQTINWRTRASALEQEVQHFRTLQEAVQPKPAPAPKGKKAKHLTGTARPN